MMGGGPMPQNPQAAMKQRPRPEDAANHITVCVVLMLPRLANT